MKSKTASMVEHFWRTKAESAALNMHDFSKLEQSQRNMMRLFRSNRKARLRKRARYWARQLSKWTERTLTRGNQIKIATI